jgi:beta-galactosidase
MNKKNIYCLMAGIAVVIVTAGELTALAKLEAGFPNKMDTTKPVWSQEGPAERLLINADWRFQKGDPSGTGDVLSYDKIKDVVMASVAGAWQNGELSNSIPGKLGQNVSFSQFSFDDSGWRKLNLPHDWGIEGPFDPKLPGSTGKLPWSGIGWYRKHLMLPASDAGRQIYLDIDGAMSYALVWCNGQFVGGWPYGYSSFRLDLTRYLKPGADNVIAIRLDNPKDSSRWYPGGGIYRNVWLVKQYPVHISHWGTFLTTPEVSQTNARVSLRVSLENNTLEPADVVVKTTAFLGGKPVFTFPAASQNVPAGGRDTVETMQTIKNPKLWSPETPTMYSAVTTVCLGDKVIDSYTTPFGIRSIEFTADNGLLINGRRVYLKGVCDHGDLGALGTAINVRALERQIDLLQEMGCNAIRTSHNPPAPELLALCDRKGMLVMDEAFDAWRVPKVRNGYNRLFDDWAERDLKALVLRDRNHPSVILWSIGNEVYDQGKPQAAVLAKTLTGYVHSIDTTRPTTHACDRISSGYNGFQDGVDVFGYNYKPGEYANFRDKHPLKPLFASETASTYSSRGYYHFAGDSVKYQADSYDLDAGGTTPDREFEGQDRNPFVAGEFVWTGFDYLGEPTPFDTGVARSSYFGIFDLCGFRKDRFYLYQARWRPELPMAHLMPHWNWPQRIGQVIPVQVYTSGDAAELFLNGKSLGLKKKEPFQYRLRWENVIYEPGELKVVAYKNGKKWATDTVKTTGPATKLTLQADRRSIGADGLDLSFITVTVADKGGLQVPRSQNHICFAIDGPGEIVATDNGDATSYESFQSHEHNAFNGLALVVVRSKPGLPGTITLSATSEGLRGASLKIRSQIGNTP